MCARRQPLFEDVLPLVHIGTDDKCASEGIGQDSASLLGPCTGREQDGVRPRRLGEERVVDRLPGIVVQGLDDAQAVSELVLAVVAVAGRLLREGAEAVADQLVGHTPISQELHRAEDVPVGDLGRCDAAYALLIDALALTGIDKVAVEDVARQHGVLGTHEALDLLPRAVEKCLGHGIERRLRLLSLALEKVDEPVKVERDQPALGQRVYTQRGHGDGGRADVRAIRAPEQHVDAGVLDRGEMPGLDQPAYEGEVVFVPPQPGLVAGMCALGYAVDGVGGADEASLGFDVLNLHHERSVSFRRNTII